MSDNIVESLFKTRKKSNSSVGLLVWNILLAIAVFFAYSKKVPTSYHSLENNKITLMGMVLNNNTYILKNGYPAQDMVFINPDWTLSQFPKYLELDESGKLLLKKYVRE